jgi:hypothetical protein
MESLYKYVVDEDRKQFEILGPIADDRWLLDKLSQLKKEGRHVRFFTAPLSADKRTLASQYEAQTGYTYVDDLGL